MLFSRFLLPSKVHGRSPVRLPAYTLVQHETIPAEAARGQGDWPLESGILTEGMRKTLIFIVIIVGLVLATPHGLEVLLEHQLSKRVAHTKVDRLSLNPFTGRVLLEGVAVDGVKDSDLSLGRIEADLAMLSLLQGELVLETLHASRLNLLVQQNEDGHWTAILLFSPDQAETSESADGLVLPHFTLSELLLEDSKLTLIKGPFTGHLQVERLAVEDFVSNSDTPASTELIARWGDTRVAWQGTVLPEAGAQSVRADINVEALQLSDLQPLLPQGQRHLETRGLVDLTLTLKMTLGEDASLSLTGNGTLAQLALRDPALEMDILEVGSIALQTLALHPDASVDIAQLSIEDAVALDHSERDEHLLAAGSLIIDGLHFHDSTLTLDRVTGSKARSMLRITEAGEVQVLGMLSASLNALDRSVSVAADADTGADPDTNDSQAGGFNYSIGPMHLEDSVLSFSDQRYQPPVALDMTVKRFDFSKLESRSPEQAGELRLTGNVGQYGTVDVEGELAPLAAPLRLQLQGDIEGASLPVLSPYFEEMLGYAITSGQFDHEFIASLTDNILDASNQVTLRKLKVNKVGRIEPVAPPPVPLGPALDMLRDSKGTIELDVPIKGDLSDPEIGTEKIIGRALGKALSAGSIAVLKYALQPYGAIWTGLEMGLKAAQIITLDSMTFPAGVAELDKQQINYADKLAGFMKDKTKLQLSVCGTAGAADFSALREQTEEGASADPERMSEAESTSLLELASARQENLVNYLAAQHQIDTRRMYLCKPEVKRSGKLSGITLLMEP